MKKLLELLGVILLTSNAAGPLVANKPNNNKAKIKNSSETLTRQKRQAPKKQKNKKATPTKSSTTKPQNEQPSTSTTDNQVEFIKKEIALNENYSDNIQKMLKDFIKNNQIDPLRMINNEGIIRTPLLETDEKEKVRSENIKLLKKLDAVLGLSEFKENKTRILILNIKNKNNNIKLVVNLNTFYLLGFINNQNNQNKYFHFQEENINELENEIKKWNELLLSPAAKELNELKEQVETLKKDKKKNQEEIRKIQEELNEKFKQIKQENIGVNAKDWSSLKNQLNDKIGKKTKKLNQIRYYRGNSEVNNKIAEEYSCEKIDLRYKEDYTPRDGRKPELTLNALNPNSKGIPISQKTLNAAVEHLAILDNDNKQSQETKDDLVRMIFVTSEAMRFGSHLKYFNHYKDKDKKEPVVFKNIPADVQKILDDKILPLEWKNYADQLRGGLTAASEFLEEQRKEIFKELRVLLEYFEIHDDFLNNLKEKIKLNQESLFSATDEIFKKIDEKDVPENIKNKIKNIWFANIFNVLKNSETMPIEIGDQMPKSVLDDMRGWTPAHVAIKTNNLDITKLLIWRQNELINKPTSSGDVPLHFACSFIEDNKEKRRKFLDLAKQRGGNIDVDNIINNQPEINNKKEIENNYLLVKFLVENGANINARNNDGDTPLHSAARNGNFEIVELLVANRANINITNNYTSEASPLDVAAMNGHIKIFKFLLKKGAKIDFLNRKQINSLHAASQKGHEEIIKLLLKYLLEQLEQRKITFDNLTNNVITASSIAKDNKQTKVQDLLEEFNRLSKLKTKAKMAKTQKEYKNKIKDLLKIELSDVITENNLGEIENNSPETIKTALKNKNLNLDIDQVKVQENSITDNAATIDSIDQSVYSGDAVIVKFTLAKKSSKPNDAQKIITKDEYQKQGARPKGSVLIPNQTASSSTIQQSSLKNLSEVITENNLGEIENNSSETIKTALKNKNPNLKIDKINVTDTKITNALIISSDENIYNGGVIISFIIVNETSTENNTQNASGNNDGSAGSNGNSDATNQSTGGSPQQHRGGSGIVGISKQAGTSGTQNQNTIGTNQNNRYDVPPDGSCLFWSIATSYLLPVRNNNEEFKNRFIQLFGELQLSYLSYVQTLFQQFDVENNTNTQAWYQDATAHRLVRVVFRNRVVDYIRDNLDTTPTRNGELRFRDLIQENNEIASNYLERMRQYSTWGGTPEIIAMSNLLNANIGVGTDSPYQPVHQNANNNNIAISYVELEKGSGIHNHYNFALPPEEDRTNQPIAINDNQGNVLVVDIIKRPDNLLPTTPKPEANAIKLAVDDHGQHHAILAKNNEDDDANQGNNIAKEPESTATPLQKDEYHFVDKKTEDDSLKNDENLEINLIKNNKDEIKQNAPAGNQPINTNMENLQTTTAKTINQYNALSKEEKLKKLNEINRYYQTLPENDKKAFKEKLTNNGLAALSGGALTAYGTKMTVSGTAATSVINAEAMEMTPLLSTSTTESLAAAETITVAETAAIEGGVIAGETGTAAALAPETLGLSLVIGGLAIAGTWMYFAFHHHATSDIVLPASIHHNVYDNIEKWYKFLAHDKLKIKINKNIWNEIKQNKNSQANITKIIKNKFIISDHSGWGGSVTNEDFNTLVKVILLHFEQINGYFEILDNENDGFVIITNTEGDWLGIE